MSRLDFTRAFHVNRTTGIVRKIKNSGTTRRKVRTKKSTVAEVPVHHARVAVIAAKAVAPIETARIFQMDRSSVTFRKATHRSFRSNWSAVGLLLAHHTNNSRLSDTMAVDTGRG